MHEPNFAGKIQQFSRVMVNILYSGINLICFCQAKKTTDSRSYIQSWNNIWKTHRTPFPRVFFFLIIMLSIYFSRIHLNYRDIGVRKTKFPCLLYIKKYFEYFCVYYTRANEVVSTIKDLVFRTGRCSYTHNIMWAKEDRLRQSSSLLYSLQEPKYFSI